MARNHWRRTDFNTVHFCRLRRENAAAVAARQHSDYDDPMLHAVRFLWNATKGHRLAPWRSPYLLWRIETYCGVKMTQIGFIEFWEFLWRERSSMWRFLKWTGEMDRYAHPKAKAS